MKKYLLLILVAQFSFGQIPTGYYNTATGTGYTLKTNLKKIIDDVNDGLTPEFFHIDRGYGGGTSQTNNGLWTAYGTTDRDFGIGFENDNTIVDMYSENPGAADPYNYNYNTASGGNNGQCGSAVNEGDCYNREHLVPQAYFDHFQTNPMKNDPNFVIPTDGKVNNVRDNFPFGRVNVASYTSGNGSKLGSNLNSGYSAGYTSTVFEPVNEFKGDIARCLLYFGTRYEDLMDDFYSGATVQSKNMFDGTTNNVFSPTFLNILIAWHKIDPVSTKEINRNNAVYNFQSNRNPYIDHPEYVCLIWPTQCAAVDAILSSQAFLADNSVSIYPNPTNTNEVEIFTTESITKLTLVNVNGQIIKDIENPIFNQNTYKLNNLPQGFYFLQISAENGSLTKKIIVN
jgi:endonuclease I